MVERSKMEKTIGYVWISGDYINDSDSVSREGEANSHESIKEGT